MKHHSHGLLLATAVDRCVVTLGAVMLLTTTFALLAASPTGAVTEATAPATITEGSARDGVQSITKGSLTGSNFGLIRLCMGDVITNASLRTDSRSALSLGKVMSALPETMESTFAASRDFIMVPRSQSPSVNSGGNAETSGKPTTPRAQYSMSVSIREWGDQEKRDRFVNDVTGVKREIRLVGDVRIFNVESGEMVFSRGVEAARSDARVFLRGVTPDLSFSEALVSQVLKEFAAKAVQSSLERFYPLQVMHREANEVDLNRDSGSGLKVGDEFICYRPETIRSDESTGAKVRTILKKVGKVAVTEITDLACKATIVEEIQPGAVQAGLKLGR